MTAAGCVDGKNGRETANAKCELLAESGLSLLLVLALRSGRLIG
jgi:hypothetical protein